MKHAGSARSADRALHTAAIWAGLCVLGCIPLAGVAAPPMEVPPPATFCAGLSAIIHGLCWLRETEEGRATPISILRFIAILCAFSAIPSFATGSAGAVALSGGCALLSFGAVMGLLPEGLFEEIRGGMDKCAERRASSRF